MHPAIVWFVVFIGVQVALWLYAGRALAVLRPRPPRPWPVRALQWGLSLVSVLGLVAVALPPGHGPNYEGRAVSPLREMASAQVAFSTLSGGLYAPPECLVDPRRCVPGYEGPPLLAAWDPVRSETSLHYRFTFHAGPAGTSATGARGVASWALVANPATSRTRGFRAFCVDARSLLVYAPEPIRVSNAECPAGLAPQ